MNLNERQSMLPNLNDCFEAFDEDFEQFQDQHPYQQQLNDEPCEIQLYDTAFPSLYINSNSHSSNSNNNSSVNNNHFDHFNDIQTGLHNDTPFPFTNDFPQLSLAKTLSTSTQSRSSQLLTTKTFTIPYEERRFVDNEANQHIANNLRKTLKDICLANNVKLETSVTPDQSLKIFITGNNNDVLESKKKIMRVLQTQHEIPLEVPKEYHRNLIGNKGLVLRDIENETSTQISIPKLNNPSNIITIRGTKDHVEHGRQSIQKLVDEVSKIDRQVVQVDKRFHQLVCHKSNTSLHVILERKGLRLDIPPLSVDKNDISVSGDRDGVNQAASIIKQTYEIMKSSYQELQIEIPREKHRFIIGPKGSHIKEILDKTNVWVQVSDGKPLIPMNSADSNDIINQNTVLLLGPKEQLGAALTEVFTKTESVNIKTITAPGWLHKFIIGKGGSNIAKLTSDKPNINLSFETGTNEIIIEGPPEQVEEVSETLEGQVFEYESQLSHYEMPIETSMIKHLIGAGGSNIQKIRKETTCSLRVSTVTTASFITIIGPPQNVEAAKLALLKTIEQIENTVRKDIIFPPHLIPQLVGQSGRGLKEIREKYPDVRITLPTPDSNSSVIMMVGPRGDVEPFAVWLQKKSKELIESSFTKKVIIPRKYHKAIIGREGIIIRDLTKTTNTRFIVPQPSEERDEITLIGRKADVEIAEQKILNIYQKEHNIIEVEIEIPKNLHTILIGKGGSRVNQLKESCGGQVTIRFPTPDSDSNTVIVKGVKEDVFKAQAKLHDLVEEVTASNYEENINLESSEILQFLLMIPAMKFRQLRETFHIRVSENEDKSSLRLVGQKEDVNSAIKLIEETKDSITPIVSDFITLAMDHVQYFQSSNELSHIGWKHNCKISVHKYSKDDPDTSNDKSRIDFRGPNENVEKAKLEILEIVDDYENTITDSVVIDSKQYSNLNRFSQNEVNDIVTKYRMRLEIVEDQPEYDLHYSSNTNGRPKLNGPDSCYSEEESPKSLSPNSHNLPNGFSNTGNDNISAISSVRSSGINLHNDSIAASSKFPKFRIFLTGHSNNMTKVKEEIIKLLVVDLEVDVPSDYYPLLIGSKGATINELRQLHSVNISIPHKLASNEKVIVSGQSENAVAAKQDILNRIQKAIEESEERRLRNFRLVVKVPQKYHRALIGIKGENISKIRNQHSVRIAVPSNDQESDEVVVMGHKDDVEKAKDSILNIIHRLESRVIEDLVIDSRIHSRLIGSRGVNLDKLKKKYQVEIAFPIRGTEPPESNIVKVKGTKEAVDLCSDDLVDQANELLAEMEDSKPMNYPSIEVDKVEFRGLNLSANKSRIDSSDNHSNTNRPPKPNIGFQVRNAPWQQLPPPINNGNWADTKDDDEETYDHGEQRVETVNEVANDNGTVRPPSYSNRLPNIKWSNVVSKNP